MKLRVTEQGLVIPKELLEGVEVVREDRHLLVVPVGVDAEPSRKQLQDSAGAWEGLLDSEELKRNIYADRLRSTRPEPRVVSTDREDPLLALGTDPVKCNLPDASENHDRYIYGRSSHAHYPDR